MVQTVDNINLSLFPGITGKQLVFSLLVQKLGADKKSDVWNRESTTYQLKRTRLNIIFE